MRVAAHAAVDETVGLARQVNGAGAGGFVNAVLRRVSEKDLPTWVAQVAPDRRPGRPARGPAQPPRVDRAGAAGGAPRPRRVRAETVDADLEALLAADNARARGHPRRPARPGRRRRARRGRRHARRALAGRGGPGRRRPRRRRGRPRRTRGGPGRGHQLLALALSRAELDRVDGGALAGHVRRPRRQGGAARHAGARRRARRLFANEISEHRAELVRQTLSGAIDAGIEVMIGTATAARSAGTSPELRPGPRRRARAPGWGAPTPPRGALASYDRGPGRPRRAAACAADLGGRRHPARRRRGLRHVQPHLGETRFVVGDVLEEAVGRRACWTRGRCSPTRRVRRSRTSARARRAALAAPARHRRDVPRPAAQGADGSAAGHDLPMWPCRSHRASWPATSPTWSRSCGGSPTPTGPTST